MGLIAGGFWILLAPFEMYLQSLLANLARGGVESLGIITRATEDPIQFYSGNALIEISPLCSGLLEMILLGAAILATPTKPWGSRVRGLVVGIALLFILNLTRIILTIMQIQHTSLAFATFTHDVLFRIVLIMGFALIYAGWIHFPLIKKRVHAKGWV